MAYYYYEYYSFSYFFLFFLFFFLLILILFPNYTKKDIVPPLSDANYAILPTSVGTLSITDIKSSTFRDLTIQDGERSNTDAIDFGGDGGDQTEVSFIPYYSESHKRLIGFFELNIATAQDRTIGFRIVDDNLNPANTLNDYNYGWTSLKTSSSQGLTSTPVYRVILRFNLPGYTDRNHNIRVQISADNSANLELSSAYLYYYSV